MLTGKGLPFGGSLIRPEATGYGAAYFAAEVFRHEHDVFQGKTFALSGFGNVAWGAAKKITELGGRVVTLSGPDGYVYDEAGVNTQEKFDYMLEMRNSRRDRVEDYAARFHVPFFPGERPWGVEADVMMPCATQDEVSLEDARKIAAGGARYYIEVANMPTTADAFAYLCAQPGLVLAPSKAVNAGGVATSALEMSQNAMRSIRISISGAAPARHHDRHPCGVCGGRGAKRPGVRPRSGREHRRVPARGGGHAGRRAGLSRRARAAPGRAWDFRPPAAKNVDAGQKARYNTL